MSKFDRKATIEAIKCTIGHIQNMDAEQFALSVFDIDADEMYKIHDARWAVIEHLRFWLDNLQKG